MLYNHYPKALLELKCLERIWQGSYLEHAELRLNYLIALIHTRLDAIIIDTSLTDEQVIRINRAFLRYKVLVFRGQENLTVNEQRIFSSKFGSLKPHLQRNRAHPDYADVVISNIAETPYLRTGSQSFSTGCFHADMSWSVSRF